MARDPNPRDGGRVARDREPLDRIDSEPLDGVDERVRDVVAVWPQIDPLVETIVSRIGRIEQLFEKSALPNLDRVGLTHEEFHVLLELQRGERSHGALCRETMSSTGAMTNRLDKLERAGFVRRKPDPNDRRGVLLELTSAGRERLDAFIELQAAREIELLDVLGANEKQELQRLLRKLYMSLHAEVGPPPPKRPPQLGWPPDPPLDKS
jgi:DNA-binding MarR family transcriptional regulator